jgi:aryl-alcohol dehydrogenase-like predicted oxidoreductase
MDFTEATRMLRTAVDAGINLFDVGVYGFPGQPPAHTDVLFSAIVRGAGIARDDYVLSSKLWLFGYPEHSLRAQLERALFRIGADHADLAILGDVPEHHIDLRQVAIDLRELVDAGLLGCWGVNNWSASNIRQIAEHAREVGVTGPQIAQLKYSVCRRSIPDGGPFGELFATGLTMQASDVMEGGLLAGKGKSGRDIGRDPGGIRDRIIEAGETLAKIAGDLGATPAQVCVAFTLTHPATVTTLFGSSSVEQLEDNLGALTLLDRVGAKELREIVASLWVDRDVVDPAGP